MLKKYSILWLIIAIVSTMPACNSSSSSSNGPNNTGSTVVLSGAISSSSPASGAGKWHAASTAAVNQVVGIQISERGTAANANPYVTADVDANKNFQLSLDKGGAGGSAVLMLLDTTQPRKIDQVRGFLTLGDSSGTDTLISLPTASASDAVDLGTIEGRSGLSNLTIQDISSAVNETVASLRERGRTDALLRNLKNEWANTSSTVIYGYGPGFEWGRSYKDTVNAADWFPVSSYYCKGNQFFFRSNDPALLSDGVCKPATDPSHVAVTLAPPQPFDGYNTSFLGVPTTSETITAFNNDAANPITETTCGAMAGSGGIAGGFYYGKESSGYANFNWGGGGINSSNFPEGIWTLKVGDEEKAHFDIKITTPVDDAGHYKVYLPSIKVIANDSGVIQYVDVLFHVWDGDSYEPITDPTLFLSQTTLGSLSLTDYWTPTGPPASISMELVHIGSGVFRCTPTATFYTGQYDTGDNTDAASSVTIVYNLYGVGLRFDLRWF